MARRDPRKNIAHKPAVHGSEVTSDQPPTEEETKPCAYCGSAISKRASICPVCKSYQSAFRNVLLYLAGVAGLIGLVGSAFAFIVSDIPNMSKALAWKDQVKVWDFHGQFRPDFEAAISNMGTVLW